MQNFCGEGSTADGLQVSVVVRGCRVAPEVPGVFVGVVACCVVDAGVNRAASEALVDCAVVCVLVGEVVVDFQCVIVVSAREVR